MLRLSHNQTVTGGLLVSDIDDGLPNKTAVRLIGDPQRYRRDGYANAPKQACYIPHSKIGDPTIAGYIDVKETDRVLMSVNNGVAKGLSDKGLLTVTSFTSANVATPTVSSANLDSPSPGDLTITGTTLTSLAPEVTSVILTGTGAKTLTQAQILGAGGSVSATSIFIPAALIPSTQASLIVNGVDANGNVTYTAKNSGTGGNSVRVRHVVAGNNTPLTVAVSGNDITVNVATGSGGAATSTATQVAAAVTASGPASALVTATAGGTGASVVGAVAYTNLAGGTGVSVGVTSAAVKANTQTTAPVVLT